MSFKVSVIVPVYNRVGYISKAIDSVICLEEVGELILIDDGSTDGTFDFCSKIANNSEGKIRLVTHPNHQNKGVSSSRNLGISKSRFPYISFLDSDDYYLPNRFVLDKEIFQSDNKIDAVFSCSRIETEENKKNTKYGVLSNLNSTLDLNNCPQNLYYSKVKEKLILFDTNSITLKKDFLLKHKGFDTRLSLNEDIELWNRLMRKGVFYVGDFVNPVSVVRLHGNNSKIRKDHFSNLLMLFVFIDNVGLENLFDFERDDLFFRVLRSLSNQYSSNFIRRISFYVNVLFWWFNKNVFFKKKSAIYLFPSEL